MGIGSYRGRGKGRCRHISTSALHGGVRGGGDKDFLNNYYTNN